MRWLLNHRVEDCQLSVGRRDRRRLGRSNDGVMASGSGGFLWWRADAVVAMASGSGGGRDGGYCVNERIARLADTAERMRRQAAAAAAMRAAATAIR